MTVLICEHACQHAIPQAGTRDFFPEDHRFRNWLFGEFATVRYAASRSAKNEAMMSSPDLNAIIGCSELFGFEQWDAPVLENEDLYKRKAGEEITEQLYNFEVRG